MSGVLEYLKILLQLPRQQHTLTVDEVCPVFQEQYVETGYRPVHQPWNYYLFSFFKLHNESLNVWTHTLATFLVLLQLNSLYLTVDFSTHRDAAAIVAFTIGSLTACVLSTTAHLLHSKSPWWHYVLFLLDYAGVTFYSFGTGVATYYIFSCNHSSILKTAYLPFNVFMSWLAFTSCCFAKLYYRNEDSKRRVLMVFALGSQCSLDAMTCLGRYYRCYLDEHCSCSSLNHMTFVILMFFVSAFTFTMHIPQKWKPGRFDIVGHGHQIFHVSVIVLMMLEYEGIKQEVAAHEEHIPLSFTTVWTSYAILFALELTTLISMKDLLRKKVIAATGSNKVE